MNRIERDPGKASSKTYDIIVIGGGIYGAMITLEASLRGLSVLLLEKDDFGGATSFNSLRTIHGGLRHLQRFDFKRMQEYRREQQWFLQTFPSLVTRLPVLMPLYQRGLRRRGTFSVAFLIYRLLAPTGHKQNQNLPDGEVISAEKVRQLFPEVDTRGLAGGALWYDATMPDPHRLIITILRLACTLETTALNYFPVIDLATQQGAVTGVHARDALHQTEYTFYSRTVINASGPWSRELAQRFDRDFPGLFRPSAAWNTLFKRDALSECALAVSLREHDHQTFFLHASGGKLLAGTGHAPRKGLHDSPDPTTEELDQFIENLNQAVPALNVSRDDILHVYSGFLPVKKEGTIQLSREALFVNHAKHGGPEGLFSVSGTRFTAARSVAGHLLSKIVAGRAISPERKELYERTRAECAERNRYFRDLQTDGITSEKTRRLVDFGEEEAICHLDDLVLRRLSLGDDPQRIHQVASELSGVFNWDERRRREEMQRVQSHFRWIKQNQDDFPDSFSNGNGHRLNVFQDQRAS